MAAALAVLEREEDLRTMAHEELDRWLDQLEAETAKGPTLRDLSERFLATRSQLLSACLETVIRQQYAAELEQTEAVCGCGRPLRRRRVDAKEISTLHGRLTLPRPYFYCDACGLGFHPLDAKLGLAPEHHQYDIQERTTRLSAELPYGVSNEQFEHLTGVPASPHFIHDTLNAVGEAATLERVLPDTDEIARRIETARAVPAPAGARRVVRRGPCADAPARGAEDQTRPRDVARSERVSALPLGQGPACPACGQLAPDRRQSGPVPGARRRGGPDSPRSGAHRAGGRRRGVDLGRVPGTLSRGRTDSGLLPLCGACPRHRSCAVRRGHVGGAGVGRGHPDTPESERTRGRCRRAVTHEAPRTRGGRSHSRAQHLSGRANGARRIRRAPPARAPAAALAWTLKAWFALRLPETGRWASRYAAEKRTVLRMEFKTFLHAFVLLPVQVVHTSRRLVFRLLAWNPWQAVFLRGFDHWRQPLHC